MLFAFNSLLKFLLIVTIYSCLEFDTNRVGKYITLVFDTIVIDRYKGIRLTYTCTKVIVYHELVNVELCEYSVCSFFFVLQRTFIYIYKHQMIIILLTVLIKMSEAK